MNETESAMDAQSLTHSLSRTHSFDSLICICVRMRLGNDNDNDDNDDDDDGRFAFAENINI